MRNRESGAQRGGAGGRRGWLRWVALLVAVGVLVLLRRPGPGRPASPGDPTLALHPWEMLGCYELRVRSWGPGSAGAVPDSVLDRTARERLRPEATPPSRVLLLADSADRWGRTLDSYRARPLTEAGREPRDPPRSLRWLVRGDTLWILWSEGVARGGVALRSSGDSLVGSARARVRVDSLDLGAGAVGWPVNCFTGEREPLPAYRTR